MILLQAYELRLSFGDRTILDSVSIRIGEGSRSALSGANGSGKSTLLKILAGLVESEGGSVSRQKGAQVSYLPQSGIVHEGKSLRDELESAFSHFHADEQRLEELGEALREQSQDDSRTKQLLEEQHLISERIAGSHYYQRDQYISEVLGGLGFERGDWDKPCELFSGGWQMRIALAKILLERPDVMLLDEPTNYLDLEARSWLARQLQRFDGGVLMVSHDKGFLDETVTQVAELFLGKMRIWQGNYSRFEKLREAEMEQLIKRYNQQQEEIQQLEDFIRRFRANASKATQVQSRVKQLEKIVPIELPEDLKRMNIRFPEAPRTGDLVLTAEDLEKSYGEQHIFRQLDVTVNRGERVVVLGPNGAGKSTLLKCLAARDKEFSGKVSYGAKVQPAYFAQESEDELNLELSIIEEVETNAPTALIPELRNILGAFLFRGEDIHKPVNVLSGGEKNRLALVKLLLKPSNLLILDEPTNHLDLSSKEILLDALKNYSGTIVFVSHDQFFIRELATRVVELQIPEDRKNWRPVTSIPGDYDYYLRWKELQPADNPAISKPGEKAGQHTAEPGSQETSSGSGSAGDFQAMKERRNAISKLKKTEDELMCAIETIEENIHKLNSEMAKPENYSDGQRITALQQEVQELEQRRDELNEQWMENDELLSQLENQM